MAYQVVIYDRQNDHIEPLDDAVTHENLNDAKSEMNSYQSVISDAEIKVLNLETIAFEA